MVNMVWKALMLMSLMASISGCALGSRGAETGAASGSTLPAAAETQPQVHYLIGPGDNLQIFVWGNPDLSTSVTVRPDGRVSMPLVEDLDVAGHTPTEVARDIEKHLEKYVKSPVATVMVSGFAGIYAQQVRVVGEAAKPQALPYRDNMTVLDVMIAVGGLTEFADGNDAKIVRRDQSGQQEIRVRLEDLIKKGDIKANVAIRPGDILIIPESWF